MLFLYQTTLNETDLTGHQGRPQPFLPTSTEICYFIQRPRIRAVAEATFAFYTEPNKAGVMPLLCDFT